MSFNSASCPQTLLLIFLFLMFPREVETSAFASPYPPCEDVLSCLRVRTMEPPNNRMNPMKHDPK